ncbi:MAG: hypothetical protein LBC77_00530 [Spirochaetaceae bacterium]|jgi:hypothetical protein|nr:hypothetical protein [Spirochaetaceae bacterium]
MADEVFMKTPEIILEALVARGTQSKAARRAAVAFFTVCMAICAVLLLPPVQSAIFEFSGGIAGVKGQSNEIVFMALSLPLAGFVICAFFVCLLFSKQIAAVLEPPEHQKKCVVFLSFAILLLLVFNSVFAFRYGWQWLSSDDASEMVLAKLLAAENTLVSRNWHYSTEIRIIYQTIFTMPLFKLLGGGGVNQENWALIRALGLFFNSVALILSYLYFIKPFKVKAVYALITALFLIVPLSRGYWAMMFGGYYTFFIVQLFFALGLFQRLLDGASGSKPRGFIAELALFSALSIALGAQGIRALLSVYIPLLIASFYMTRLCAPEKKRFTIVLGIYGFVLCLAGYAVNYLLRLVITFSTFLSMRFEDLYAVLFTKIGQCAAELAGFFGMTPGNSLLSVDGLFSTLSIAAAVLLIYSTLRLLRLDGKKLVPVFFLASAGFNIFIFIIVYWDAAARYFIPFMIFYIPITAIAFNTNEKIFSSVLKRIAILSAVLLFVSGRSFMNYGTLLKYDVNTERKGYINYLLKERLDYGFATYWNANVTTELSNGKIELAPINELGLDGGENKFNLARWLQPVKFNNSDYYKGESFLLLTEAEWKKAKETGRPFSQNTPDYEDGHFVILRFRSAQSIHSYVLDP